MMYALTCVIMLHAEGVVGRHVVEVAAVEDVPAVSGDAQGLPEPADAGWSCC